MLAASGRRLQLAQALAAAVTAPCTCAPFDPATWSGGAASVPSHQDFPVRSLLTQALQALTGRRANDKAKRKLFDVEWFDEYATLGDDPHATHALMLEEDQRLRSSTAFLNPLRRQVFEEITSHRQRFAAVRATVLLPRGSLRAITACCAQHAYAVHCQRHALCCRAC